MRRLLLAIFAFSLLAGAQEITPPKAAAGTVTNGGASLTANCLAKGTAAKTIGCSSATDDGAGNVAVPGAVTNQGSLNLSQLATPANATLVVTGGAAGNYTYKLVAKTGSLVSAANSGVSTAVGPTTLDGTHFIDINFVSQAGCTSIDVYRTVGGAAQGKIGNVLCTTSGAALTLRDNALVGDASTAPTINTTGVVTGLGGFSPVGLGVPIVVATSDQVNQTGNVGVTLLFTPGATPAANYYEACAYTVLTTVGTTSTLPVTRIRFTDPVANTAVATNLGATSAGNSLGTASSGCFFFHAKTSTAINFDSTGYASTGTAMVYETHIFLRAVY